MEGSVYLNGNSDAGGLDARTNYGFWQETIYFICERVNDSIDLGSSSSCIGGAFGIFSFEAFTKVGDQAYIHTLGMVRKHALWHVAYIPIETCEGLVFLTFSRQGHGEWVREQV